MKETGEQTIGAQASTLNL